jgi:hypothetical protein
MSSEISITLKATDEASGVKADAGRNITESMQGVEEAGRGVAESQQEADASAIDLVMGFSGLATAGFSLYSSFDRIESSALSVNRANLQCKPAPNHSQTSKTNKPETPGRLKTHRTL